MRIPVKSDYALRAATVIARAWPDGRARGADIAAAENLPLKYLHAILVELKIAGIVRGRRGQDGGYTLTRPPKDINVAAILQAVDCPLIAEPGALDRGAAAPLWSATEAALQDVLREWSLADLTTQKKTRQRAQRAQITQRRT